MMLTMSRMTVATTIAVLLLAGCAERPTTRDTTPAPQRTTGHVPARQHDDSKGAVEKTERAETALPESTGIAACDDYLSSYLACHRAAGIFAPNQLQYRYEAMRTSLLRDSQNPDIRPQLATRCNSLATQLRHALNGKACTADADADAHAEDGSP